MGIVTDEKLTVTRVQTGTLADGQIQLGDVVKKVNSHVVTDRDHLFKLLQRCSTTQLTLVRSSGKSEELAAARLHPDLEKLFTRRAGFDYSIQDVDCAQHAGKPLGLILATINHGVYTKAVRSGSVAEIFFKKSDRILLINGTPLSDTKVARAIIQQSQGRFRAIVERATSEEAKKEVRQLEETARAIAPAQAPASVQAAASPAAAAQPQPNDMPQDVQEIVAEERRRRRASNSGGKSILLRSPSIENIRVSVDDIPKVHPIASDVDPNKILRKTPRG